MSTHATRLQVFWRSDWQSFERSCKCLAVACHPYPTITSALGSQPSTRQRRRAEQLQPSAALRPASIEAPKMQDEAGFSVANESAPPKRASFEKCGQGWPLVDFNENAKPHSATPDQGAAEQDVPQKQWSRPISRVLSWTTIPLGRASPRGSSNQPGDDAGHVMVPLFGLAPGGVCRAGLLPDSRCALTAPFHPCLILLRGHRRFAFCCTVRRLAPPRRYLAPCPVEPGLSSASSRTTRLSDRLRLQV